METRHYRVAIFALVVLGLYFAYRYYTIKQRAVAVEKSTVVISPSDPKNNGGIIPPTILTPSQPANRFASYLGAQASQGSGYVADGNGY